MAVRQRGSRAHVAMTVHRIGRSFARTRPTKGFSLLELLMVVAILGILASIAIGVTPGIIRTAKGQAGAQQLSGFLKRTREAAISRRRNIEVVFSLPNRVQTFQRAVPNPPAATPAPTLLETLFLEGRMEFRTFPTVPDTPDDFVAPLGPSPPPSAIQVGAILPVLFTSEGQLVDGNGDPVSVTLFLGQPNQVTTANALSLLGTTAMIRTWRWDGRRWVK
jgi:prepilin-type N-terminal cleavage/methylation domain-containing protein